MDFCSKEDCLCTNGLDRTACECRRNYSIHYFPQRQRLFALGSFCRCCICQPYAALFAYAVITCLILKRRAHMCARMCLSIRHAACCFFKFIPQCIHSMCTHYSLPVLSGFYRDIVPSCIASKHCLTGFYFLRARPFQTLMVLFGARL